MKHLVRLAEADRLAILIGAGVSMQPPTSFPSGVEWRDSVVRTLLSGECAEYHKAIRRLRWFRQALPEIVFQELEDAIGFHLVPFFAELRFAVPNVGHRCLAELARRFDVPLVTTNFDTLLEADLNEASQVLHLHGSLDRPRGLVTRLAQTKRGLSPRIRSRLTHSLNGRTLLVLGYSGNDEDVLPAITASRVREVLWITRPGQRLSPPAPLTKLVGQHTVQFRAVDLRMLFQHLSIELQMKGMPEVSPTYLKRLRELRHASRQLAVSQVSSSQKVAVAHNLLLAAGRHSKAAAIALAQVRRDRGDNADQIAWLLNGAADALRTGWQVRRARLTAERALALKPVPHQYYRASSWNQIGLAYLDGQRLNPIRALRAFRRALSLLDGRLPSVRPTSREAYQQFLARVYNNIGLSLAKAGQHPEAIAAYRKSLAIKRRLGDVLGIATTLTNMAIAGHRAKRSRSLLDSQVVEAEQICVRYDLRFKHPYLLREVGVIRCEAGALSQGLAMLRRAKQVGHGYPGHERLTQAALRRFTK